MTWTRAAIPARRHRAVVGNRPRPRCERQPDPGDLQHGRRRGRFQPGRTPVESGPGHRPSAALRAVIFQGVNNGTLTGGQPFNLGQFVVIPPPTGTTTTYTNVPFEIAFNENTLNGAAPSPNGTPVVLHGFLSGTIGPGSSTRFNAYINPVMFPTFVDPPFPTSIDPFQTGGLINGIDVPGTGDNGQMIQAILYSEQSVPEPGTLAIFAMAAAYAARRWAGGRRKGDVTDRATS